MLTTALGICGSAAAQSSVTVFGVLDLAVRRVSNDGVGSNTSMAHGANQTSRFGIRGSEDLGDGWSAGFHLESQVGVNTGGGGTRNAASSNQFWDRVSTVRLTSRRHGELRLGYDYAPVYGTWARADPFAQIGLGSNAALAPASLSNTVGAPFGSTDKNIGTLTRVRNSLAYYLPAALGGFNGALMATASDDAAVATSGQNRYRALRVGYNGGAFETQVAYATTRNSITGRNELEDAALHVIYDFGRARVALATRQFEYLRSTLKVYHVGLWVPLGSGTFKAAYSQSRNGGSIGNTNNDGRDASLVALGYQHDLSKRTVLYTTAAGVDNKSTSRVSLPGGPAGLAAGRSSKGIEVGVRHSF